MRIRTSHLPGRGVTDERVQLAVSVVGLSGAPVHWVTLRVCILTTEHVLHGQATHSVSVFSCDAPFNMENPPVMQICTESLMRLCWMPGLRNCKTEQNFSSVFFPVSTQGDGALWIVKSASDGWPASRTNLKITFSLSPQAEFDECACRAPGD